MSMHCQDKQQSPSKENGQGEIPCCKVLRATFIDGAKIVSKSNNISVPLPKWILAVRIATNEAQFHRVPVELDTGPPAADSFAESILQRSLLAHAPPFVA